MIGLRHRLGADACAGTFLVLDNYRNVATLDDAAADFNQTTRINAKTIIRVRPVSDTRLCADRPRHGRNPSNYEPETTIE